MSILIAGQVLNGLATGMLYAMVGVGLTLVLGVLNIPNFAHGTLYAFGAYFTFTVANWTDSFYLGVLIGPLLVVLIGFVIESQGVRRLYGAHHDYQLLFLFAIALILQETVILIWGPVGFSLLPPKNLAGGVDLGLERRLALVQHRGGVQHLTIPAGQELGRLQPDRGARLPRHRAPLGPGVGRGGDRLVDGLGVALVIGGQAPSVVVREDARAQVAGRHIPATDDQRDLDRVGGERVELRPERGLLRGPGRVIQDRFVAGRGDRDTGVVHREDSFTGHG